MGLEKLNEYRVDFADNTSQLFMAKSTRNAVCALETDAQPIAQITRLKTGIGIETPIRNVKFNVTILPESASENKCHVAPNIWVVPEDTKVIFTAMPSEGFQFDGWFEKDGTDALSEKLVDELLVTYPSEAGALTKEFEARFSPIPDVPPTGG